jgi:ABC transporter substrate binding protein (PQQ-dependent alcohol dehydrogenase system)
VARCLAMFNSASATRDDCPVGLGRTVALEMLRRNTISTPSGPQQGMISTQSGRSIGPLRNRPGASQLLRVVLVAAVLAAGILAATATDPVDFKIGYLRAPKLRTAISLVEVPPENNGLAGAQAAITDNNTTGQFLGQRFSLEDVKLKDGDNPAAAVAAMADRGISIVLADLPADALLRAADAGRARGMLLFNVGASDERLRENDCRPNVIHTAPSRAMLADALAQYLVWKQWRRWFLVVGSHEADKLFAEAIRRAARRFGAKIVEERVFEDTGGSRRSDSGVVQVQRQLPVFTQQAPAYDVLVAADESEVFAGYLPYRTWDPRPVAGSAGLVPTSWDASNDQWGATQMQDRFIKQFARRMTALDMQAWTAVRMIGESATRTGVNTPKAMLDFIKGPDFALAAFKGQKLTVRDWNLQLRQPILLTDGKTIVSVSPQEGFLHQFSELDTLGFDRGESKCKLN